MQNALAALNDAVSHQQAGRWAEAEALYKAVLAADADHADALAFYGALKLRLGEVSAAIPLLSRAVQVRPDHVFSRFSLANALMRSGGTVAAADAYRALLERDPNHTGAWTNLGSALVALDDVGGAVQAFGAALSVQPGLLPARAGLAAALLRQKAFKAALVEALQVLRHAPRDAQALMVAGTALQQLDRFEEAEPVLRQATLADPGNAHALLNHANTLARLHRVPEAAATCRKAVAADPCLLEAQASLVSLLTDSGQAELAVAAAETALAQFPEDAALHWNAAMAFLQMGDWAQGWREYGWRKRHPSFAASFTPPSAPAWDGADLTGRRLLVIAEQGLGDTIQFARYLPWLAAGGAQVTLAAQAHLLPLLSALPGVEIVDKAVAQASGEWPECDVWADMMDIPGLMRARPDTIPNARGYLFPDKARARAWRAALPKGTKIGLVWAGNPDHAQDAARSIPPDTILPLLEQPGLSWVNLQVGRNTPAIARHRAVFDAAPALKDFGETAAVIANLDLVIAVDTATAHCAGAMGKPVWLLLPYAADWRWQLGRQQSPWYAGMRVFRQRNPGDWAGVIDDVQQALAAQPAAGSPPPDIPAAPPRPRAQPVQAGLPVDFLAEADI